MANNKSNIVEALQEEVQHEPDQASLDKKLADLRAIDLSKATVNLWVTNVKVSNKSKRFGDIKNLKVHSEYQEHFRQYVIHCIKGTEHIEELRPITTIQDNRFFYVESSSTDLTQLIEQVENGELTTITQETELNNYNAYVIQLTFDEPEKNIYAFRYIKGAWSLNNTANKTLRTSYQNNRLVVEIDQSNKFQITPYVDFIQYESSVFIADLTQFETAMNYHERLKEKKAETISALGKSFAMNADESNKLISIIGDDKRLMRQLASVYEKQHFNNELWLRKLRDAADEAGNWQIKFDDDGKIKVIEKKEYVKELLVLLQNKRVKTVVDGLMFDVEGELVTIQPIQP
ncbi:Kiwa anti-phage protein KwaB-like domain-containing protein [Photobacterium leiognathi]|uniref:Kiwa anti-phage protein KwaB-like domain-containing protein n=1 Tax=Photobacterium leiognathi TaxID=553611 RepID=UPI002735D686|nr:Kiwa anti-phage protein KwaB-like domain-containing protein [Photobacterium leiognathi]